jgi:hypothetical protein
MDDASVLKRALGYDWKGKVSPLLYAAGIVVSFWLQGLAQGLYVLVAVMWLKPDHRIEHVLQ